MKKVTINNYYTCINNNKIFLKYKKKYQYTSFIKLLDDNYIDDNYIDDLENNYQLYKSFNNNLCNLTMLNQNSVLNIIIPTELSISQQCKKIITYPLLSPTYIDDLTFNKMCYSNDIIYNEYDDNIVNKSFNLLILIQFNLNNKIIKLTNNNNELYNLYKKYKLLYKESLNTLQVLQKQSLNNTNTMNYKNKLYPIQKKSFLCINNILIIINLLLLFYFYNCNLIK